MPTPAPVLPDFGVPLQIVHAEDVAQALVAGVLGRGEPGIYNLAAAGEITLGDVAEEMGWNSVRLPKATVDLTGALVERFPFTPAGMQWIQALRVPVVMDTDAGAAGARLGAGVRRPRDAPPDRRRGTRLTRSRTPVGIPHPRMGKKES